MTSEPSLLFPREVESLLNSLERISKLNNDKQIDPLHRQQRIKTEANTWIHRLQLVLRTRK